MSTAASAAASSKWALLADDVPWRVAAGGGKKPVPRIHHSPLLRVPQNPSTDHALAVMRHSNPVGEGFTMEAKLEAAGPDCVVPGQITPVKLLGLKGLFVKPARGIRSSQCSLIVGNSPNFLKISLPRQRASGTTTKSRKCGGALSATCRNEKILIANRGEIAV